MTLEELVAAWRKAADSPDDHDDWTTAMKQCAEELENWIRQDKEAS